MYRMFDQVSRSLKGDLCRVILCSDADEAKIKEETSATIRCFPFDQPEGGRKCLWTGKEGAEVALFAKSY
jgi:hypothetical protein